MQLITSEKKRVGEADPGILSLLEDVSTLRLRGMVERISVPRHLSQPANVVVRGIIEDYFRSLGFRTERQGTLQNIVAYPAGEPESMVGAHYDSVVGTPGADDNASAVAGMLEAARVLGPQGRTMFAAFNGEEEGLLGSREFAQTVPEGIREIHILEMIGFTSLHQYAPPGFPVRLPKTGDFLALLANRRSCDLCEAVTQTAKTYGLVRTLGLKIHLGLEKFFPVVLRSDHAPFWEKGIPCLMWTDTSEFRNPHYHQPSDLPGTLDYRFLAQVTKLLVSRLARGLDR